VRCVLLFTALVAAACWAPGAAEAGEDRAKAPYATWTHGLPTDDDFFPVAVWLQSPANAERYKAAGINLYVGLWGGPTEEQLAKLKKNGMRVICSQNAVGLNHKDDPTIVGWMRGDEPDNTRCVQGSDDFVASIVAPTATGWNDSCRAGFASAEDARLCTAQ
jgi:hypothetical protein